MHAFLILALLVTLLAIVFTLQNMAPVTVVFLIWTFHGSLALVLFLALAAGAMICFFASLPQLIKRKWMIADQKKKLVQLEDSLEEYKHKLYEAQKKASGEVKLPPPSGGQPSPGTE